MPALVELSGPAELRKKQDWLFTNLASMGRLIVAFSGGTDSAYLAWAANRVLAGNTLAMTADSASLPESHKRDAEAFVQRFGILHEYIQTYEFDNPDYVRNDPNRCFHCKDELFTRLEEMARDEMERALTLDMARQFTAIFKALGFRYVTLDLEGYRQGSLNEVLNLSASRGTS